MALTRYGQIVGKDGKVAQMPRWLSLEERFEAGVDRTGGPDACHLWRLGKNTQGYGQIGDSSLTYGSSRNLLTHVLAWQLSSGLRLQPGQVVRHTCDVPACCNPRHLLRGTRAENARDMQERDRTCSKLTTAQVEEIRRTYDGAWGRQKELALQYEVSCTVINFVIRGRNHRHVPLGAVDNAGRLRGASA